MGASRDYIRWLREKVGHERIILTFVGGCIRNQEGEVLLQRRSGSGLWGFPGGAIEPGETVRMLPFERRHFGLDKDGVLRKLPKASFLPSPEVVMDYLIPNYAKGLIYGAMVEAFCCEQQARMTAMDAATNSAKDMIREMSLMYNRARQAAITQEITEVAAGARALEKRE